ncbi:hypothetical protein N7454_005453 [Penicillium verhagenii]|nr:hypothetical protein N7454_005453 [Penicillium verhagenii]
MLSTVCSVKKVLANQDMLQILDPSFDQPSITPRGPRGSARASNRGLDDEAWLLGGELFWGRA